MPGSFEDATALERLSDGEHRITIPEGWEQGRGAFGGLVLGILMDAMLSREPDAARVPRAFTGNLCGPALPRESRVLTRLLRRGNNQTNLAATFEQDGAVVGHATCSLSLPRKVSPAPHLTHEPPARVAYEDAPLLAVGPSFAPRFAAHYEYRATGPLPFSAGPDAVVTGWIKEREPLSRMTAAALLGRLDAYWPALFSVSAAPRPIATVSFFAQFLCDPATLDPRAPLFYRARVVAEAGGYFVEMRELWDGETLVALNQQSVAMLA